MTIKEESFKYLEKASADSQNLLKNAIEIAQEKNGWEAFKYLGVIKTRLDVLIEKYLKDNPKARESSEDFLKKIKDSILKIKK